MKNCKLLKNMVIKSGKSFLELPKTIGKRQREGFPDYPRLSARRTLAGSLEMTVR
jgi:hypothetical protein